MDSKVTVGRSLVVVGASCMFGRQSRRRTMGRDGPACPFLPPPFNACAYTVHMGIGQSYQSATLPLPSSLPRLRKEARYSAFSWAP